MRCTSEILEKQEISASSLYSEKPVIQKISYESLSTRSLSIVITLTRLLLSLNVQGASSKAEKVLILFVTAWRFRGQLIKPEKQADPGYSVDIFVPCKYSIEPFFKKTEKFVLLDNYLYKPVPDFLLLNPKRSLKPRSSARRSRKHLRLSN